MSRKNRPNPTPLSRTEAICVGALLLVCVYYSYPFGNGIYHRYVMGKVLGLGLVLTLGTIWFWFRPHKWK